MEIMNTFEYRFKAIRVVLLFIFLVYLVILLKVVLFKVASPLTVIEYMLNFNWVDFKRNVNFGSNFVPFKTISNYVFHSKNQNIAIRNIMGNLVLFMPFGFLVPVIVGRKFNFVSLITISFLCSLVLELIQLFSRIGSFDVDDLILNTLGALLGFTTLNVIIKILRFKT